MIPQLQEVVRKYNVNGVWLDAECWGAQIDYSEAAHAAWQKFGGDAEFPAEGTPAFEEFKRFHRLAFETYMRNWIDALHREFPDLDCCSNWAYTTMMPEPVAANVAMVSGDFDPFLSVDRARTECRYLENIGAPWELQSWGFDLIEGQGPCRKTVDQLCQEAAVVMMHGGGYMNYFLPTRGGYIPESVIRTLEQVSAFVRSRERFSHRSVPVYQMGILYPTKSQLKRSPNVYTWWGNRLDELEGALHLALENQYCATVVAEHQLQDVLPQLKCLVIAECDTLDEAYIRLIENYVAAGGRLILLSANAAKLFHGVSGIRVGETQTSITAIVNGEDKIALNGAWAKAECVTARPFLYRYTGNDIISNSEYMDAREGLRSVTADIMQKETAVTINFCNKGCVAAVLTDFGRRYFENHHPYLRNIFKTIAEEIGVSCDVEAKCSHAIDLSLRRTREGTLVLHLMNTMNMPVGNTRKFTDEIPFSGEIKIRLRCARPQKVVQLPENEGLHFTWKEGWVTVVSKGVRIHGALRFEIKGDQE